MLKHLFYCLLLQLFLIILFSVFPRVRSEVSAQSLSLTVEPPVTEIMIKPGRFVSQKYTLKNQGEDTLMSVVLSGFNENGLADINSHDMVIDWINPVSAKLSSDITPDTRDLKITSPVVSRDLSTVLLIDPFLLPKNGRLDLILNISPAKSTKEQDYYMALVFSSNPKFPARENRSQFNQSLAGLLLVTVTESGLKKIVEIPEFNLPVIHDSFSPLEVDIQVKNSGQTYFRPNGNLVVIGPVGQAKFPLIPRVHLVGQSRPLLLEGMSENKISGFFLGKYQVRLDFVLDEGKIKIIREKTLFALPWKLATLIISTVLLITLMNKLKSRYKSSDLKHSKKVQTKKTRRKHTLSLLLLLELLPALFLNCQLFFPRSVFSANNPSSNIPVKAKLGFRSYVRIYGYTSPYTIVKAEAPRTYGTAVSDNNGFFFLDNLAVPDRVNEICLESLDAENRSGFPVCLPVPQGKIKKNLGPVFLPPTLSLSHNLFYVGQQAFASGRTLPYQTVKIALFEAKSDRSRLSNFTIGQVFAYKLPVLTTVSDYEGRFNFTLPTGKVSAFRLYAAGDYKDNPIPKSQTIYFYINPLSHFYFQRLLPLILWTITSGAICVALYLYDKKTGTISSLLKEINYFLSDFIDRKYAPFGVKLRLKRKRLWYNLRALLKLRQK